MNFSDVFTLLRGECGFLRLASFGELAHNIENLLDDIRNDKIKPSEEIIEILLQGVDYSKSIIEEIKGGHVVLFNKVTLDSYNKSISKATGNNGKNIGDLLVRSGKLTEVDVVKILQKQKEDVYTKKFGEIAVENNYLNESDLRETLGMQRNIQKEAAGDASSNPQKEQTSAKTEMNDPIVKVRASRINYLVDMIGELLIAEGMMNEKAAGLPQIKKITKSIQYAAMQLRTEKVKTLFTNMKRIVRDVSKKLDKEIVLNTLGEELEIDRNLIENLEEPMLHMIRNSIHHGIEPADERLKKGKTAEGHIILSADRRGNSIVISITDDGGGLNKEKIINKAIDMKLVTMADAKAMNDNQIYNMIFMQGFSTAEKVDLVSGRGVGMDISGRL